jgi:hypothetical protein
MQNFLAQVVHVKHTLFASFHFSWESGEKVKMKMG